MSGESFPDEESEWTERARCKDTDLADAFFPEKGGTAKAAKLVCAECTVRSECLNYALTNDEKHGIWGGMTETERRRLKNVTG